MMPKSSSFYLMAMDFQHKLQTTHYLMNIQNLTRPDYDMHSCSNHGFSDLDCQGQNVIV